MAILCHSVVPTPLNSCLMHSYQRLCMQASTSVRLPWCWTNFPFRSTLIAPHYRRRSSYGSKTKQHAGRIRIFAAISNSQSWTSLPYVQINECLVYPPPSRRKKPKAVLQFLGGAFIGAAPEITYSLFIELLAKDGFLAVAVPYNVTFDHAAAVEEIHQKFNTCLDSLLEDGVPSAGISPSALSELPVISVGHSNGALMQVLIGSICKWGKLPKDFDILCELASAYSLRLYQQLRWLMSLKRLCWKGIIANVIISFNNKPATDAVPFFDQTGPTLSQISTLLETSPISDFAKQLTADGLRVMLEEPLPFPPGASRENLESARKFLRQIPGVVNQVTQGISEFLPSPAENQKTIMNSYVIPHNLLVKFTIDSIDETDMLESIIRTRTETNNGSLTKLVLTGTHATPLTPDIKWKAGEVYTPIDAVGQLFRTSSIADLTRLVRNISDWFETVNLQQ